MAASDKRHDVAALRPGKSQGTNCTGGWVGHRAGLDGFGKEQISYPNWGSNTGQSSS
jgi:hypothetical protein